MKINLITPEDKENQENFKFLSETLEDYKNSLRNHFREEEQTKLISTLKFTYKYSIYHYDLANKHYKENNLFLARIYYEIATLYYGKYKAMLKISHTKKKKTYS